MKNGYWNAGVDNESSDYLAFATPWGTFAYQVAPMGFVSSAAHCKFYLQLPLGSSILSYHCERLT